MGISTPLKFDSLVHQIEEYFHCHLCITLFDSVAIMS